MLNQDYWLTEFISISSLIRKAPIKYARSFLYSEQDEGDLTYFISYQLEVIRRSIVDLHEYLQRKVAETRELQRSMADLAARFNHRQMAVLERAMKNADAQYTVTSHSGSHNVSAQTARTDLQGLEREGLLIRIKSGRGFAWIPAGDVADKLR
jgi:Fic family protein